MKARLLAVQRALLMLVFASLVVAGLTVPRTGDRNVAAALAELTKLQAGFVREDAERALREQAESGHGLLLAELQPALSAELGPKYTVRTSEHALQPLSSVSLATLADTQVFMQPGEKVRIALPTVDALSRSIALRLRRATGPAAITLESAELVGADVSPEQTAREDALPGLLVDVGRAALAEERATLKLRRAEKRLEARKKRRARSIAEYQSFYDAARETFEQKSAERATLMQRYESEARHADLFDAGSAQAAGRRLGSKTRAAVRVEVARGESVRSFDIPVELVPQAVEVAPLRFASLPDGFATLHTTGLWDEVKRLDARAAALHLDQKLHWQFKQLRFAGLVLTGALALQVLPCILIVLLMRVLRATRLAAVGYSPFTARLITTLPRVGFKYRFLELVVLVLLPLLTVMCAALALVVVGQLPILPALCGIACVALGSEAFVKLQELRDLSVSIEQYHSYPPKPMLTGRTSAVPRA